MAEACTAPTAFAKQAWIGVDGCGTAGNQVAKGARGMGGNSCHAARCKNTSTVFLSGCVSRNASDLLELDFKVTGVWCVGPCCNAQSQ